MHRAFALVSLAACASPVATVEQPIIGGSADAGDAAVVLIAAYPSDRSTLFTCTAEVIAPTALLTAAHCLDHDGYTFGAYFGADASSYTTLDLLAPHLAAVTAVHLHPAYDRAAPFTADIGVVTLADAAPTPALPFARALPAGIVGAPARIVGYGQTVYNQYHAARDAASTQVVAIDSGDTITIGDAQHATCVGDSGGPGLVAIGGVEQIVGIDSYADTTGCTQPAHFRRTDLYAGFIDQYAGTAPAGGGDAGVASPDAPTTAPPAHHGGCAIGGDGTPGVALLVIAIVTLAGSIRRRTARVRVGSCRLRRCRRRTSTRRRSSRAPAGRRARCRTARANGP
jgi:hypothetical protein